MANYAVFDVKAEDVSTNGLGVVQPQQATVHEQAGGLFECELVIPITADEKWRLCQKGRLIRVPTPTITSPTITIVHEEENASGGKTLNTYAAVQGWVDGSPSRIGVWSSPIYGKVVATLGVGDTVTQNGDADGQWIPVTVDANGAEGWVRSDLVTKTGTRTVGGTSEKYKETIKGTQSRA